MPRRKKKKKRKKTYVSRIEIEAHAIYANSLSLNFFPQFEFPIGVLIFISIALEQHKRSKMLQISIIYNNPFTVNAIQYERKKKKKTIFIIMYSEPKVYQKVL